MFFSTSNTDEERSIKDEIWGCWKNIGISLEALKTMTIRERRYYIMKHNAEMGALKKKREANSGVYSYSDGESINKFAQNMQTNEKNGVGR